MSTLLAEQKEIRGYNFPQRVAKRLFRLVETDNYREHVKVKKELVKEGEHILPFLHKLLSSDSRIIRKEVMKVIQLIAYKSSIPYAIDMLEDQVSEIRWIAAVTLIRIGRESIRPMLEALINDSKSYFLRQGAHHVLSELVFEDDPKELKQLVKLTKHNREAPEVVPVKAADALSSFID